MAKSRAPQRSWDAVTACLAAFALVACSGSPAPRGSATPGVPSSTAASGTSTSPTSRASASPRVVEPGGPLPEPALTDPAEIGAALWEAERVDQGVVSLIDQLGVPIYSDDGAVIRPAAHPGPAGLWLFESEVRGLIEMGREDAAAIAAHESPFVLGDLSAALATLLPAMTEQQILDAYIAAYRAAPGDLVRESLAGHAFIRDAPFTRVHLWLLLVDGVIGRDALATASNRVRTVATVASWSRTAAAQVAAVNLPAIPSPVPGLSQLEFALLLAHGPLLGTRLQVDFDISPSIAHEGHGQAGPLVAIIARNRTVPMPVISPLSGTVLLAASAMGFDRLPIEFQSPDVATLEAHGSLRGTLRSPILTDSLGVAQLSYQVDTEPVAGEGPLMTAAAQVNAVIDLRTAMSSRYLVPPQLLSFIWGTIVLPGVLALEWHEAGLDGDFQVTLTGPKEGAGQYSGHADIFCVETPNGSGSLWTVVAQPKNNGISDFNVGENPSGWTAVSVETKSQTEFSPWFARSDGAGQTASLTVVRNGPLAQVHGTGSWTDSAGRLYTIDIQATCTPLT